MTDISFIVPVYNVEKYLERCIDSLLYQDLNVKYEIILIDDGSSDKSGMICDEYAHKSNKVKVIHKENEGVSKARNIGISQANGKYITFVDSDDFVNRNMLKMFSEFLKSGNSDIVFCGHNNINNSNKDIKEFKAKEIKDINLKDFLNKYFNYYYKNFLLQGPFNKIYKREIIKKNKMEFDDNLEICEDTIFSIEFLNKCNNISSIEECCYNYMQNGSTNTLLRKFHENEIEANWKLYNILKVVLEKNCDITNNKEFIDRDFVNRFIICFKKMFLKSDYNRKELYCAIYNFINDDKIYNLMKVNYKSNILNKLIFLGMKHKNVFFTYVNLKMYVLIKKIFYRK